MNLFLHLGDHKTGQSSFDQNKEFTYIPLIIIIVVWTATCNKRAYNFICFLSKPTLYTDRHELEGLYIFTMYNLFAATTY